MNSYTVNVSDNSGDARENAKEAGYHAYSASGITAIEIKAANKKEAKAIASQFGKVLYVFE
jgi:hypothetical protein